MNDAKGMNKWKLPITKNYCENVKKATCGGPDPIVPIWDSAAAKAAWEHRERGFLLV
jgi:hypothetical protein